MTTATMKFLNQDSEVLTPEEVEIYNVGIAYQEAIRSVYTEPYYRVFCTKDPRKGKNWPYLVTIQAKLKARGLDPFIFARITIDKWNEVTKGKFCSIHFLKSNRALQWYYEYKQNHKFSTNVNPSSSVGYAASIVSSKLGISREEAEVLLGGKF